MNIRLLKPAKYTPILLSNLINSNKHVEALIPIFYATITPPPPSIVASQAHSTACRQPKPNLSSPKSTSESVIGFPSHPIHHTHFIQSLHFPFSVKKKGEASPPPKEQNPNPMGSDFVRSAPPKNRHRSYERCRFLLPHSSLFPRTAVFLMKAKSYRESLMRSLPRLAEHKPNTSRKSVTRQIF